MLYFKVIRLWHNYLSCLECRGNQSVQFDKKKQKILELYQSKPKRQRMFKGEKDWHRLKMRGQHCWASLNCDMFLWMQVIILSIWDHPLFFIHFLRCLTRRNCLTIKSFFFLDLNVRFRGNTERISALVTLRD